MFQVYHGRGKGKTSAAIGAAVRAAGHGWPVLVAQFMKDAGADSGEVTSLRRLPGVILLRADLPHSIVCPPNEPALELLRQRTRLLYDEAARIILEGSAGLAVLDELGIAVTRRWIPESAIHAMLDRLSPDVELILTGRHVPRAILDRADLVTRMTNERHPWDRGVAARRGIEY